MWRPYDSYFSNTWMLIENFFYFSWINIIAAYYNHIIFTINNIKITFIILTGHIARIKPSIFQRHSCFFWYVIIARHHIRPLNDRFTYFTDRNFFTKFINDFIFHIHNAATNGPWLSRSIKWIVTRYR